MNSSMNEDYIKMSLFFALFQQIKASFFFSCIVQSKTFPSSSSSLTQKKNLYIFIIIFIYVFYYYDSLFFFDSYFILFFTFLSISITYFIHSELWIRNANWNETTTYSILHAPFPLRINEIAVHIFLIFFLFHFDSILFSLNCFFSFYYFLFL